MPSFVVVAQFQVAPRDLDRFVAAARTEALAVMRSERGCQRFDVVTNREDPGRGLFYEVYDNEAAFEAHQETPHFDAFFEAIDGLEVSWSTAGYHLV